MVSIQPKPKKGLVVFCVCVWTSFGQVVSIQPKPKKGLVGAFIYILFYLTSCFNPAEAEEGFSSGSQKKE